jgi:nitroreductase
VETWDAISSRRNVRSFTDQAIAPADLERILEAGWRAPSASNAQRRDFVVATDRAQLKQLAAAWRGAGHVATSAATVVLVAPTPASKQEAELNQYDIGQATMLMALAAADRGIGSGHAAVGDSELVREILGIPKGWTPLYFLALGYPADRALTPVKKPDRRPFDEVVHHGHW